jgi:hypothetical protein
VTAGKATIDNSQIEIKMAAPTFEMNLNLHRAVMAHHECEWKQGKGSTQRLKSRIRSMPTATAILTKGAFSWKFFGNEACGRTAPPRL